MVIIVGEEFTYDKSNLSLCRIEKLQIHIEGVGEVFIVLLFYLWVWVVFFADGAADFNAFRI